MPRRVAEFLGGGTNHAFPNYTSVSKSPQSINQYAFLAYDTFPPCPPLYSPLWSHRPFLFTRDMQPAASPLFPSRFSPYFTRGSSSPSDRNASATRDWPTLNQQRAQHAAPVAFSFSRPLSPPYAMHYMRETRAYEIRARIRPSCKIGR